MATKVYQHALNVGQFDRNKLHRVDLERMRLAAERQVNLLCDAAGPAWSRPGTEFLNTIRNNAVNRQIAFIAGPEDAFLFEFTDSVLRVLDCDTDELVTRVSVSTAITSGDFSASTGWTLASTSGQSSTISTGMLRLKARAHGGLAKATQTVTVAAPDQNVEHALRIVVDNGPIRMRIGSTSGGAEYLPDASEAILKTGTHSIAFTPTGNFYLEFSTEDQVERRVDSVTVEAAGIMELPTIWPADALQYLRVDQSLDVMFVACDGYQPQRIERRGDHSWSVADYDFSDGPFFAGRTADVSLTPAACEGNTTLSSDRPFFKAEHVGAIFRLFHEGQKIETYLAGANEFTQPFLITGITETNFEEREFTYTIAGTWSGTLKLQRAYDGEDGQYHDYRREQASAVVDITANATYTNDDNDDNIEVYVKLGFPTGSYTSGEAQVTLNYPGGGGYGVCRVVGFTSSTQVTIEVIEPFKGKHATKRWREGMFSDARGWPSALAFNDGRLDFFGSDQIAMSISDAFESFDEDFVGDAGPIIRSIAIGGRNKARWAMSLSSLMVGCDARIVNVRANTLDEILTPENTGIKSAGRIGAAPVSPAELADDRGVFVQSAGNIMYELTWSTEKGRYVVTPFSKLTASMFASGITGLAVQVLPDQRLWVTVDEGDAVCIVFEPSQQVLAAHVPISTCRDGEYFESIAVIPASDQDRVYASVKRVIDGNEVRYLEKFAKDSEVGIADITKIMDSHVIFGAGSTVISGLDHLEGAEVVVWVDGEALLDDTITDPTLDNSKVFTVSGGQITLPEVPVTGGCVGLAYDYQYKSARLAFGAPNATPMLDKQRVAAVGLMLADYQRSGVKWGVTRGDGFSTPFNLPLLAGGTEADEVVIGPGNDEKLMSAAGQIGFDERVCVAGRSPKPLTIQALVLAVESLG